MPQAAKIATIFKNHSSQNSQLHLKLVAFCLTLLLWAKTFQDSEIPAYRVDYTTILLLSMICYNKMAGSHVIDHKNWVLQLESSMTGKALVFFSLFHLKLVDINTHLGSGRDPITVRARDSSL